MRKLISILLCLLLVASIAQAYSVKGKVYQQNTSIPIAGAAVSLTADMGSQILTNSGSTASDGSFLIKFNGTNCTGKKMTLVAKKGTTIVQGGSKVWLAQQESETKNVYVVVYINLNPDLILTAQPAQFISVGDIQPIPVKTFNFSAAPVMVQGFNINLNFDANALNVVDIVPGPLFPDVVWDVDEVSGEVAASGTAIMPFELPPGDFAVDSFFDIFFEVEIPAQGEQTRVTIAPDSFLFDPGGMEILPIPADSLSKIGESIKPTTNVYIDSFSDWDEVLLSPNTELNVRPMYEVEWVEYMDQWSFGEVEGTPYPSTTFIPAQLYIYQDDGSVATPPYPEGDGLIMTWGDEGLPTGSYASAWTLDYGVDPDLTNCTIQVTVMPPATSSINAVSFAMVDINGLRRSWWWNVPVQIPYNVPTTVTINTAVSGLNAAIPLATGYLNTPGFDITQVQSFDVDENASWVFGTLPVPPFNTSIFATNWNYWHNLIVRKNNNIAVNKGIFVKYSQPPVELDSPDEIPRINGWDEVSILNDLAGMNLPFPPHLYSPPRIMADDWECTDQRPVTDVHWWGSFLGWTQPTLPPDAPKRFHIGIWTDVPAGTDEPWSHPGKLVWENYCDSWVWNFSGIDIDPRPEPMMNETCFQFNQFLSEDEWFWQEPMEDGTPNIYWLSIVPIYDAAQLETLTHPWGWKTRPHAFQDDAVRIMDTDGNFPSSPPAVGDHWTGGEHVFLDFAGEEVSWDLSFELTTNKKPQIPNADINRDGFVDLIDFSIFADQWLTAGVTPAP